MARIRSVHPGLFTDEAFVELSEAAQVLLIGIWTECDDYGLFDWKPATLKMRLRGGKDGDISDLLSELERGSFLKITEIDGVKLGVVRNFRRFQKPKFPKSRFTISRDIRSYIALTERDTEKDSDELDPFPHGEERRGAERRGAKLSKAVSEAVQPVGSIPKTSSSSFSPEAAHARENGGSQPVSSMAGLGVSDATPAIDSAQENHLLKTLRKNRHAPA